ncbi:NADH-quinone oxidoreductase subunit NuoF [Kiritimatiella glycovorans]|uniref:NAD-reducing hydrogenase subunit HoxF n=1 Tax=Kiritimatiella glycovorans TaxID=1307763 RepID=A0A0G3EHJ4_9BACT|nr:NADH-quinone oxidoreductase subunit NuoF [Kiritimatiella glycovorans]AKJ63659.1 NAD-reducing hydrogenase subunit HoxF [Kiritimatiella glycovorans]
MAYKQYILVCSGTACESNKGNALYQELNRALHSEGLQEDVQLVKTGCFGFCEKGPIIKILPDETFYVQVDPDDAKEIASEHLVKGRPVERLIYRGEDQSAERAEDLPFYRKQLRLVLRNCGVIDPDSIDEYIAREGYAALEKALFELGADRTIDELMKSGLRGRGGAGFLTAKKWLFTRKAESEEKYVVCNADEGDPGAYMDRSTLEGDPHSVLEAMTIAGYTVGAQRGYIYIRAEYPLAIERLQNAIEQARGYGLLGEDILGSGFGFDIEIRLGAGAFVCGEETALLASIEGRRGMPVPRPPFPAVKGLWGKPTVINNVETFANVPLILLRGGDWFSKIGTETSKGTKVFALTGKINNSGLIEVPMGTTLREIIYDIGGGIKDGRAFKAVQTGGPSGGVIPADHLDTPIDYENLQKLGSIMGSGGMIVMDEDDCMVSVAKFYLEFTVEESCGKCAPCRVGGRTLFNILDRITRGEGEMADLKKIRDLSQAMRRASLCGLGQTASNPVASILRHFEDELTAHIKKKKCPSGKCKDLVQYYILPDKCIGCTLCARHCPVNCISGERQKPHVIDINRCIKCGECYKVCKFGAVMRG